MTSKKRLSPTDDGKISFSELVGDPTLLDGEDPQKYAELSERVKSEIAPRDIFEEIWAHDILELVWEGLRLRGLKAHLLNSSKAVGLQRLLGPVDESQQWLIDSWLNREEIAIKGMKVIFEMRGFSEDSVMAQTLAARLVDIERIDTMITRTEARWVAILREIDRHREVRGETYGEIKAIDDKGTED